MIRDLLLILASIALLLSPVMLDAVRTYEFRKYMEREARAEQGDAIRSPSEAVPGPRCG